MPSVEQTLLAYARSDMLAAKARAMVHAEASKGCRPEIASAPVALEPPYQPILPARDRAPVDPEALWTPEPPVVKEDLVRLEVWISPNQPWDWKRSERFLKQRSSAFHRAALEIVGNSEAIRIQILCHKRDAPSLCTTFRAEFEQCELSPAPFDLGFESGGWDTIGFRDYHPTPPYSHLLTRPDELRTTLYAPIIQALASIPAPGVGLYQVVFAAVPPEHDWHRNVQALLDLEFTIKLMGGLSNPQRYSQQAPSGDLKQMAADAETKAHDDKPFFAVALRVAAIGVEHAQDVLACLASFKNLIQNGGRPLNELAETDYAALLSRDQIRDMFTLGLTHRSGFLANSWELTSLVHVPPIALAEPRRLPMVPLETLPPDPSLAVGTPIGTCLYAGREQHVCIPPALRTSHLHLIGRTRTGKSTLLERMILDDIEQGHGVAVLDPHGTLVQRLLCLISAKHADRVIYADPGDPDRILLWNPLSQPPAAYIDRGRVADDIVSAFKSFVSGWGDRLEHLLRHAIEGVMHLSQGSLFDVSNLLRKRSQGSKALREQILQVTENEVARLFWREDFERYGNADLSPPQHKLSKLLGSGSVSLMLSQPDSAFRLREIMDTGRILLVDLSTIGSETREILGCFMLSLLHLTALSRSDTADADRRPFHIHCDEAHRFLTDALEDLIAETRKFGVGLTLAHQTMSQFGTRKTGALSSVGSTVIFNIDARDAQYLRKDLMGKVDTDDLIGLGLGEAIARIDTEIVRVRTPPPLDIPANNCRDQIIAASRARYYRPADEVRQAIRHRGDRWLEALSPTVSDPSDHAKEFAYVEF